MYTGQKILAIPSGSVKIVVQIVVFFPCHVPIRFLARHQEKKSISAYENPLTALDADIRHMQADHRGRKRCKARLKET